MLPLTNTELRNIKSEVKAFLISLMKYPAVSLGKAIAVGDDVELLILEIERGDLEYKSLAAAHRSLLEENLRIKEQLRGKKKSKKMPWEEIMGPLGPPQEDGPDFHVSALQALYKRVSALEEIDQCSTPMMAK